ncbi:hypothetical protein [Actinophytocola gossypii]|uniref:DUF222 domain-containing protein n=1 Tax=Actinophytocola gossypii TaxID=2812003 RepID=A0ABT2J6U5_9PSEU|nr:hypothetical protein [Actinophytocola gossypii]MCT2583583.1 hypothetical protein [Actinophytocola gossypii]
MRPVDSEVALPRGMVLASAWAELGDAVAPLSNATGRPLARTVKLIVDPLVVRPAWNRRLAGGSLSAEHADELRRVIADAGPVLAATAAWFLCLKRARRRAGITEGNPQDLYFQRCYELAVTHGHPGPDADGTADRVVAEPREPRPTVDRIREHLADPGTARELIRLRDAEWDRQDVTERTTDPRVAEFLAGCDSAPDPALFAALVSGRAGARGADLEVPGVAREHGLSDRARPAPPELGREAVKTRLPKPFDRSILERLVYREVAADVPVLVREEVVRSARPWQLGDEPHRVTMVLGRLASTALGEERAPAGAAARLRSRWRREAYVHRVLRLPAPEAPGVPAELRADVHAVAARGRHRPGSWSSPGGPFSTGR